MSLRFAERVGPFLDRTNVRWIVGVALPLVLLFLDPLVFRKNTDLPVGPLLAGAKPFAYTAIVLGLTTLGAGS